MLCSAIPHLPLGVGQSPSQQVRLRPYTKAAEEHSLSDRPVPPREPRELSWLPTGCRSAPLHQADWVSARSGAYHPVAETTGTAARKRNLPRRPIEERSPQFLPPSRWQATQTEQTPDPSITDRTNGIHRGQPAAKPPQKAHSSHQGIEPTHSTTNSLRPTPISLQ
jgi:hypothetical protein